jgi:PAS domain-containing protein
MRVAPGEALLAEANSPIGGAMLIVGCVLALVFALLTRLLLGAPHFRSAVAEVLTAGSGELQPGIAGIATVPVISYTREGSPQAWNPAAREMFGAAPPPVNPATEPFRAVCVAIVRAASAPGDVQPLRMLLDSCSLPVLAFDSDGAFSTTNAAAARMLGWTTDIWRDRRIGPAPVAPGDSMNVAVVLILEGQIAISSGSETVTANSAFAGLSLKG